MLPRLRLNVALRHGWAEDFDYFVLENFASDLVQHFDSKDLADGVAAAVLYAAAAAYFAAAAAVACLAADAFAAALGFAAPVASAFCWRNLERQNFVCLLFSASVLCWQDVYFWPSTPDSNKQFGKLVGNM